MRAWYVHEPGSVADGQPVLLGERADPEPAPGQVLVRVSTCGVCRTDLHLAEGDLAPRRPDVVPGHEVVGEVEALGAGTTRFEIGTRVGVAWLRATCGRCRFCRHGRENLCRAPRFTGWDDDGGYAQRCVVDEAFAYRLPERYDDAHAAPLLCSGIIGYRALRRANLPPGGRLGIYGFGASAHLTAQLALAQGAAVHVLTRSAEARELARDLGVTSVGAAADGPPEPLDAAILFAPVGDLVPLAMRALDRGGTLAVAGIHLSDVPALGYERELFQEKTLCSVTANTRRDADELLALASRLPLQVMVTPYPFDRADAALRDLASGRVTGAAVLQVG